MLRVYALGGILVRVEHWLHTKKLIQQEIEWDDYYRSFYWSGYILVESSSAGILERKTRLGSTGCNQHRGIAIVVKSIQQGTLRESVSDLNNDQLALLIRELDGYAAMVFVMGGWDWGWSDIRIRKFLEAHEKQE